MPFSQPTFIFHFQVYHRYKFSNGQNLNAEKALEAQIGPQNILKKNMEDNACNKRSD